MIKQIIFKQMRFIRLPIFFFLINILPIILITAQENLDYYSLIRIAGDIGLKNKIDSTFLLDNRLINLSLTDIKRFDYNINDSFDVDNLTKDYTLLDSITNVCLNSIFGQIIVLDSSKISLILNGKCDIVIKELKMNSSLNLDKFDVECRNTKTLSYYSFFKPIYSLKKEYAIVKLKKNTVNKGYSILCNYVFVCKLLNGKWIIDTMDYYEEQILIGNNNKLAITGGHTS